MDKPISVGDLVMSVYSTECGCTPSGRIFRVTKVRLSTDPWVCVVCGQEHSQEPCAEGSTGSGTMTVLRKLKRIPPLSELEGQPTQEDIKEPA